MQQPCLVCGRKPSDPHHLRYVSSDPKNDEISATATTQDETRRGEMLENRGDVKM
jgi:hypothetical protein